MSHRTSRDLDQELKVGKTSFISFRRPSPPLIQAVLFCHSSPTVYPLPSWRSGRVRPRTQSHFWPALDRPALTTVSYHSLHELGKWRMSTKTPIGSLQIQTLVHNLVPAHWQIRPNKRLWNSTSTLQPIIHASIPRANLPTNSPASGTDTFLWAFLMSIVEII